MYSGQDTDRIAFVGGSEGREGRLPRTHACLVVLQGAEIGRDFRLRKPRMVIGRSPEAEIRLLDPQVSRAHALLLRSVDQDGDMVYEVQDLGSANRTFVNGRAVGRGRLADGDKIRVGDTFLKFVLLDEIEARFHAEIRHRIKYDQLSGLLTKESLYLALGAELERCLDYGLPLSLMMMDLDFFKTVNDTYGHLMGSHVLAEVGRLIREAIRDADVSARYGGEEFISYLAETDAAGAVLAAERIRQAIEVHRFSADGQTARITISIGVAAAPANGRDIRALVAAADRALYQAKGLGRNRVCVAASGES